MERWKNASRADCISGISTMLATLAANVKLNSKSNRNDLAVISEHTICGLLNLIYDWNLRNANTSKHANFPSVDLVDPEAGIAVQVTVDNSLKKVDHTLAKFKEYKLNRQFTRLIIMVITTDDPTPTMKNREDGCFYGERDIWNISRLLKDVENEKSVEKLRKIAKYLDNELGYGVRSSEKDAEENTPNTDFPKTTLSTKIVTEHTETGILETHIIRDTDTGNLETRVIDTAGDRSFETHVFCDGDTGDFGTRIFGYDGDKSFETTIVGKEIDGTKTIGTTILIKDDDKVEDQGNQTTEKDTKEPKKSFLTAIPPKRESRKQKQLEKKAQKKEDAQNNRSQKRIWLLVPVILLVVVLLICLIPEKKLEAMPPELADYSVTINGETVSLPTTLGRLEEMGWILKDAEEYMGILVPAHSYYAYYGENEFWSGAATLTNGHGTIEVRLGNASNHAVPFEDCIVYEIACYSGFDSSYTGESVNTLEGPLGLIWKQSSFRDVKWPKGFTKDNSFGTAYSYQLSDHQQYEFGFDRNSKKLKSLRITNRDEAAMAAMLGDAYDTQPPEYDRDALADWLGVRLVFTVYDLVHNYELPVGDAVAEYQELGYAIEKQPEFVVSKDHADVYFRCDTLNQLHTDVCNPFRRALTPENCFICVLDSLDIDTESTLFLEFSDGEKGATFTVGTYESILRSDLLQQGILCETGDNGELIIYPNPDNKDITIKCWVSKDTGKITRIRVDICKALQDFMEQQVYQKYLDQKFEGIG